jgi:hypothetical protein
VAITPPVSASFAPPEQPASIIPEPPVTADTPEADNTPESTPPPPRQEEPAHPGTLERVKRSPAKIALAATAAAVLFFIVRKLR